MVLHYSESNQSANNFTFAIIKPRAVQKGFIVSILKTINESGFRISAMKLTQMTLAQAKNFYAIHHSKDFFNDLVNFMASGPILVLILEKEDAVQEFRKLIGSTDPGRAESGTIRNLFAESIEANAIHGSDSDENAQKEAAFFFSQCERY